MAQSAIRSAGGSVSLVPLPHWVVWSVKAIGGNAAQALFADSLLSNARNLAATMGLPSRLRRSEEHTSELQSLMRISYAVFCLKKKNKRKHQEYIQHDYRSNHPTNKDIK